MNRLLGRSLPARAVWPGAVGLAAAALLVVVFSPSWWSSILAFRLPDSSPGNDVRLLAAAYLLGLSGAWGLVHRVRPWAVHLRGVEWRCRRRFTGLHLFDATLSIATAPLWGPLLLLLALAVRWDSPGPAFYTQRRVGRGGSLFRLLKLRTMRVDAEALSGPCWAAVQDPRVTSMGRVLRRYHLDELPQLWNVLRGEMSLIGPRPERPEFVEQLRRTIPDYDFRHSVRPGLTGWAQVRCPYGASVNDARRKLEYDLAYIERRSWWFDAEILLRTIGVVLLGRGAR